MSEDIRDDEDMTVIHCPKEGCDGRSDEGDIRTVEMTPGACGVLGLDKDGALEFDDCGTEHFYDGQITESWDEDSGDDRATLECRLCMTQFPLGEPSEEIQRYEDRLKEATERAGGFDEAHNKTIRCKTCKSPFAVDVKIADFAADGWVVVYVLCPNKHTTNHILAR